MEPCWPNPHDEALFYSALNAILYKRPGVNPGMKKTLCTPFIVTILEGIMVGNLLIGLVIFALFFVLPTWPHSNHWGYYPAGMLASVLVLLLILSLAELI